jgi:hypothetical protein
MNPLNTTNEPFQISLRNPNPKSGRNKEGPWYRVSFEIDEDAYAQFQRANTLTGMVIEGVLYVSALNTPLPKAEKPRREPNTLAQSLHQKGYFRNPLLWECIEECGIYTQDQHHEWIKSRPCILRQKYKTIQFPDHICSGSIDPHHTTSAALPARGEGPHPNKVPNWYEVPMCHGFHRDWVHGTGQHVATRAQRAELVEIAVDLTAGRMKEMMKIYLGIGSLSEINEVMLHDFEVDIGLWDKKTSRAQEMLGEVTPNATV